MSRTILCAIADDDCLHDVVHAGRVLAATGELRPVFAHVGPSARLAPAPVGFGAGRTATATAAVQHRPALLAGAPSSALVEAAGLWDEPMVLATGDPASELDRIGREHDAVLVIAGNHGRGLLSGTLHGSVPRALARTGSRPVVLVRRGVVPSLEGPVVCAIDLLAEHHARTAAHAALLAACTERPLVLVYVAPMEFAAAVDGPLLAPMPLDPKLAERAEAREALEALAARLPVDDVECVALEPAPIIPRLDQFARGRGAGFLVVGSRGSGVLRTAVHGSVSQDLMRTAGRPLVVVPPGSSDSGQVA
jgi:nucleotide-binding universal stress UspA family protein